jgi:hypothetical protein
MIAGSRFGLAIGAEDAYGNITNDLASVVTIAMGGDSTRVTINGPNSVAATGGVANFPPDLTIDTAGSGYSILASSPGFATITIGPITVVPGPAIQLVVLTEPPASPAQGTGFGIVVAAEDEYGNVDASFSGPVHVATPAGAGVSLGGISTLTPTDGLVSFEDLTLSGPSTTISLPVTSTGLTGTSTSLITLRTSNSAGNSGSVGSPAGSPPTTTGGGTMPAPVVSMTGVQVVRNKKHRVTEFLVGFRGGLNPAEAESTLEYQVILAGRRGSFTTRGARPIRLLSADLNPMTDTVALLPSKPFVLKKTAELVVDFVHGPLAILRSRPSRDG